jgi:Dynamin central region/Dynamin family/Dynamin GTPase effector domain
MLDALNNLSETVFARVQQSEIVSSITGSNDDTPPETFNDNLKKLSDSKVIQINNELNGIFNDQIKLPRITVVGGQSSGKSTVLNNIITMNILPTGSEMVTRTPLCMELSPSDSPHIEFGNYIVKGETDSNAWKCSKSIRVTHPEPKNHELLAIKNEIERQTILIAGKDKNISHQAITIKIFLPDVPNLTLIDLPGITQVACKDKGQPSDIKEQIEKLIGNYIQSDETIILSVIPARTDVEADVGVGLIKQYDPDFTRTIGVLTKVDLMNSETNVAAYVKGEISKNLKMNYGYFLVRNRSGKEMDQLTMKEGFEKETQFFKQHPVYSYMSDSEKKKIGTHYLRDKLVHILSDKIKEYLPIISKTIHQKYNNVNKELMEMGVEIPTDSVGKRSYVHQLILKLSQKFIHSLEGNDNENINVGRKINEQFTEYKNKINNINAIDNIDIKHIDNICKDIEGNHMAFLVPSIKVFETCMKDKKYRPILQLLSPSLECTKNNSKILSKLISELLASEKNEIYRYPKLVEYLEDKIINQIILPYEEETVKNVNNLIKMEEGFIWTDSENFKKTIADTMKNKISVDSSTIKILLVAYYNIIKEHIKHNIPSAIMFHLIDNLKDNLLSEITSRINNDEIINMLEENSDIHIKRSNLVDWKNKLEHAKKKLE